jgi:hypothetical protein
MNEPMKTRLSVVAIRSVVVSSDLSAVADECALCRMLEGDNSGESSEDDGEAM